MKKMYIGVENAHSILQLNEVFSLNCFLSKRSNNAHPFQEGGRGKQRVTKWAVGFESSIFTAESALPPPAIDILIIVN